MYTGVSRNVESMNHQSSLFEQLEHDGSGECHDPTADGVRSPQGLLYRPEFISAGDEKGLLEEIDRNVWLEDIARRVQHYGFKYDYSYRRIDGDSRLGPLPSWLADLDERVRESLAAFAHEVEIEQRFDQAIINEYQPGQGIAPHTDRDCFGPLIATISLGSDVNMDFLSTDSPAFTKRIEGRSLLALSGNSRSVWRHGIAKRKTDSWMGSTIRRCRRVSITFRTVL